MREILRQIILIIFLLSFLFAYLRYFERHSIYFPMHELSDTPRVLGFAYQEVNFSASDGVKLNGWYIPLKEAKWTLLFSHGNAGNISHRLEKIKLFHELGLSVFIFDYRGYGKSLGRPSEKGLYRDIDGAYHFLTSDLKIPPERIILYGESLGSAVIINLASRQKVGGLITEGAFTKAQDLAKRIAPFIPSAIFASRFDSLDKIAKISVPKLFIHSENDEIVPFRMTKELFAQAKPPKELLPIKGGHNDAFFFCQDMIKAKLAKFLEQWSPLGL